MNKISVLLVVCLLEVALGHGRMLYPPSRQREVKKNGLREQDQPWSPSQMTWVYVRKNGQDYRRINSVPGNKEYFACHGFPRYNGNEIVDVQAGGTLRASFHIDNGHWGGCSLWISYDVDADENQKQFFKFWQNGNCRDLINEGSNIAREISIPMPSWLINGRAILRFEWNAHSGDGRSGKEEFYPTCGDIQISNGRSFSEYTVDTSKTTKRVLDTNVGQDDDIWGVQGSEVIISCSGASCNSGPGLGEMEGDCDDSSECKAGLLCRNVNTWQVESYTNSVSGHDVCSSQSSRPNSAIPSADVNLDAPSGSAGVNVATAGIVVGSALGVAAVAFGVRKYKKSAAVDKEQGSKYVNMIAI